MKQSNLTTLLHNIAELQSIRKNLRTPNPHISRSRLDLAVCAVFLRYL
jgi:hypothetical protein